MTKEKILKAAINQYSIHNYHGATMKVIADEVKIKPASIYFFYKNKEELFLAAFKKILNDHFEHIKQIVDEVKDQPILKIYESIIKGTVHYHKQNMNMTNAYISLVTSPPASFKQYLHSHMQNFDKWIIRTLTTFIKRDFPEISDEKASQITKQFILLMDGIFWEINLYDDEELHEQINQSLYIMEKLLGGTNNE